MCVVSNVIDRYYDYWRVPNLPTTPYPYTWPWEDKNPPNRVGSWPPRTEPRITEKEIKEFKELLEKARKWDEEHNEPDCESDDKINALLDLADELGVKEKVESALREALG